MGTLSRLQKRIQKANTPKVKITRNERNTKKD